MCRTKHHAAVLAIAAVLVICAAASTSGKDVTPQIEQEVLNLMESWHSNYVEKDSNGILGLLHPGCEDPTRELFKMALQHEFDTNEPLGIEYDVKSITTHENKFAALVSTLKMTGEEKDHDDILYILKPHEDRLLVNGFYEQLDPNAFNVKTRVYTSDKGKISLTIPEKWTPLRSSGILQGIVPDSVTILAPDLESKVLMGLAQMPMKLDPDETVAAQKTVQADCAMLKRQSSEYTIIEEGPVSIGDMKGYRLIDQAKIKSSKKEHKVLRAYYSDSPMLYFFICDAVGPNKFDALLPDFEAIIASFTLLPIDENLTRSEALAAEQAEGAITGQVYSSKEFNCFIAAPAGWEIRTSPNPAHLVEMQYKKGKSIARIIAVKGLRPNDKLDDVFNKRIEALKGIVQEFSESSRQEVSIHGMPGIESIHTFNLEALGRFDVKEVTLVRDGTYYLILCQCIEPDDFSVLEKDFDKIIESFGFIQ